MIAFLQCRLELTTALSPKEIVRRLSAVTRHGFVMADFRGGAVEQTLDDSGASDLYQGYLSEERLVLRRRGSVSVLSLDLRVSGNVTSASGAVRYPATDMFVFALFAALPPTVFAQLVLGGAFAPSVPIAVGAAVVAWPILIMVGARIALVHGASRFSNRLGQLLEAKATAGGA